MIRKTTIITILTLLMLGFSFVYAAELPPECAPNGCNADCPAGCDESQDPDCSPNGCCGDNIVQSPNGEDPTKYEKCDEGGIETESCTATCGQKMLGWAWADTFGWLSLNSDNCQEQYLDPELPVDVTCNEGSSHYVQATENNTVFGWAWSDNIGWVCFGQSCLGNPPDGNLEVIIDTEYDAENPQLIGWAQVLSLGDEGWFSLSCENDLSCNEVEYRTNLALGDFNEEQRFTIQGFSWSGLLDGTGMGWLWFDPEISEISPWLQTKYGDIYARAGLSADQEAPGYNATYRILSGGGLDKFRSAKGEQGEGWWVSEFFGPINFPTPETRYSNILGKLDVSSQLCEFQGNTANCINNQGKTVIDLSKQSLASQTLLEGKIYYYNGNLDINSAIEFMNASGFSNGSGTIIVDGDLTIKANITYDPSDQLTRFRNLASVAWIVMGDLNITSNVRELSGNFIVIGDGISVCTDEAEVGCGQINTCYNESNCGQYRLTVNGLMMARKFNLNRTYTAKYEVPAQGSEVILYDGRLLANTPPGLGDFAAALPIWRSGIFSR